MRKSVIACAVLYLSAIGISTQGSKGRSWRKKGQLGGLQTYVLGQSSGLVEYEDVHLVKPLGLSL